VSSQNAAATFDPLRPKLIRIAYRMLGSVADAEDMVQEAFLRWLDADRDAVREPEAYLRRVVTRLCLDHLKSAWHRREPISGHGCRSLLSRRRRMRSTMSRCR
jgi:RNA polymerase sigma-70 factor (ECF subfamily)